MAAVKRPQLRNISNSNFEWAIKTIRFRSTSVLVGQNVRLDIAETVFDPKGLRSSEKFMAWILSSVALWAIFLMGLLMNCFDPLTVVLCDQALHMSHLLLPIWYRLHHIGYMIKTYCSVERKGMWFGHWITISIQLALKLLSNWDFSLSQETFFQTSSEIRIQTISGHWYSALINHCYTF